MTDPLLIAFLGGLVVVALISLRFQIRIYLEAWASAMSVCATCRNRIWWQSQQKATCRYGPPIERQFYGDRDKCEDHNLGFQEIRP